MKSLVNGNWISGFSVSFGHGNAFLSEILAIEHGLRLAWNLGHRSLICATDCYDAMNVLTSVSDVGSYWAADTICRVKSILAWDWNVTVIAISRDQNLVADALACTASANGSSHRIWRSPPTYVIPFLA